MNLWKKLKKLFRGGDPNENLLETPEGREEALGIIQEAREDLRIAKEINDQTRAGWKELKTKTAQDLRDLDEMALKQEKLAVDLKRLRKGAEELQKQGALQEKQGALQEKQGKLLQKRYKEWKVKMGHLVKSDPDYEKKYQLLMRERQELEDELTRLESELKNITTI